MAANRVKLTICGANYVIVSEDEESYVQELGTRLDEEMNELMTKNQAISVTGAAVLKALDYLDELRKATMSADNMRGQVRDYLEDAAKARLATQEAQQEIAQLRRQIADPPAQRSGEGGRCQKFPVCQQADDVHQIPLHRQAVVAGFPAAGILVEDPQPLVLVRAVRQPDAQRDVNPLPLLDGLENAVLAARLKPSGQIVDLEGARAIRQRRGCDVALLLDVKFRDHSAVPALVHAGDDLHHSHPPPGPRPLGHRDPDGVRVVDRDPSSDTEEAVLPVYVRVWYAVPPCLTSTVKSSGSPS